jgi:GT2 family glycosyltransferase
MTNDTRQDILISIVIVNYKVPHCLIEALHSLRLADLYDRSEVIIIDNASGDNSRELVTSKFREVKWIQLNANIGFGKACNVGVEAAGGRYLLLLNPDTVISGNTLSSAVEFMEAHPSAGLVGPKILNTDGTLQHSCRRSIPTPSVAFYYLSGLSYLFPKSKRFGRYHLTYMDEDETAQVDVISGSFMFMKRELFNEIGGFDKRFFMYGEDIDLCYRITQAGYGVWYYPHIKIIHQKGKSSSKRRIRSRIDFYEAMIIFSQKYRNLQDMFFPWWLMWVGIVFQGALNIGAIIARSAAAVAVDLGVINLAVWAGFGPLALHEWITVFTDGYTWLCGPLWDKPVYADGLTRPLAAVHAAVSFAYIFMFLYNGIYSARQYSVKNLFFSGMLSSALVLSGVHFLTGYCLDTFVPALAAAVLGVVAWRAVLPLFIKGLRGRIFAPERALIIGDDEDIRRYIGGMDRRRGVRVAGIVRIGRGGRDAAGAPSAIGGYPVLGGIDGLEQALSGTKADTLLIAASKPWYSDIIDILARYRNRGVDIRWETMK